MRRFLLLATVLLVVWIYVERERIYLHDFVAQVQVNGVKETTHGIYINASNDLLLIRENPKPTETILVRNGSAGPVIAGLNCFHWLACMTSAQDNAASAAPNARVTKTSRVVTFTNPDNQQVMVKLW